ncbi:hypothetical protein HOI18_00140 [Candidatus Uhrbacteria bacterium]|jgi:hypothetical protein|nr:hypothetical protein [Candidatus Uhrbacteria bacterium]
MPSFMMILALFGSVSFADDIRSMRAEYRVTLVEELAASKDAESVAVGNCGIAKKGYLSAVDEVIRVDAELETKSDGVLGDVRVKYVADLEELKKQEVVKLADYKLKAQEIGGRLVAARKMIAAIEAEIAGIDQRIRLETNSVGPMVSASTSDRFTGTSGYLRGSSEILGSRPAPQKILPDEFALCFPDEVAPGS